MTAHPYWAARDRASPRSFSIWYALGRVRSGVSWEQAQSEMSAIAHQLEAQNPENKDLPDIRVAPLHAQTTGRAQLPLAALFGSVFLMLLIACINVANLLLARGSAREREFAVRRALGASRGRLAGQLLIESLALSITGAALGLTLAAASLRAIIAFGPREILQDGRYGKLVPLGDAAALSAAIEAALDQPAELVAVVRCWLEQREHHQLGAAFLELAIEHTVPYILHSDILCKGI